MNPAFFRETLAVFFLAVGLFFILTTVVGVLRLPDFFTRLHAISKCETVGIGFTLLGFAILSADWGVAARFLLIGAFVMLANPTATHALGRAALRSGVRPLAGEHSPAGERPSGTSGSGAPS